MTPERPPKRTQNGSKMKPEFVPFLVPFSSIWGVFWVAILGSKNLQTKYAVTQEVWFYHAKTKFVVKAN